MINGIEEKESRIELNYACLTVLFAILLGGGTQQNLWSDHLIQVLAVPLLFLGFYRLPTLKLNGWVWAVFIISLLIVLLQFLPLRGEIILPNSNTTISHALETASPSRSIESILFFATCLGLFLYVSSLSMPAKIKILKMVLIAVLIHSILVVFQLSYSGSIQILGVLPFTIRSGLFANDNHFSTLLFTAIPILGFIYLCIENNEKLYLFLSLLVVLLLFAAGSRAGIAFAFIQFTLTLLWYYSQDLSNSIKVGVIACLALTGMVGLYFLDFSGALAADVRSEIYANTWHAIQDNWLLGSGLGTFFLLYPPYETVAQISTYYINHVHGDYLELLLELGIIIILPIFIFVICVLKNIVTHKNIGILGIALMAILAHSLVDYPLRTFSVAVMFASLSAVLFQKET